MVFKNAYHGGTLMFGAPNPLNLPHQWIRGVFNDIEATRPQITSDLGVILVEPMQGVGGMLPGRKDFLDFLRSEASRIGAILIFDEIITSRLFFGGLQEHMAVIPDMTTIGKHFGGGFSFGAFGGRKDIMDQFDPLIAGDAALHHSGTWNNNMFSMTAGCVGADLLSREALERTAVLGERLRQGLRGTLGQRLPGLVSISGISNVTSVTFGGQDGTSLRHLLYHFLLQRGIYVSSRGFISLNITHQDEHVDRLLAAVDEFAAMVSE
jgi:glutamate-1-semialdehyde 2,1-aminomutase